MPDNIYAPLRDRQERLDAAMHAPIERNEAQETADKPLYTPASLIGPLLGWSAVGVLAFAALLALAFR